ncbi:MAG TPA: NADP-dependent phosphogluconate dehydrogenase, partial [Armatimonadota bacterium]|nr:NADP-dependent phosphogluconate dehydrogenase [Armatimonadota bacterium]
MPEQFDIGIVGLGVMGRNFALNIGDHGFSVIGYDRNISKLQDLRLAAGERKVLAVESIEQLVGMLKVPRSVMMLVPAGPPVDAIIQEVLPFLEPGDMFIDGGNSHFTDTNTRAQHLIKKGIYLLGVGISGGEHGARFGPSLMPGGDKEAYERVRPIFEAVAAKVDGEPCVRYLGSGSAGHYVKMVHNGIEYGIMQLISETYDLMKRGLGLTNDELHSVYDQWNQGEINSYLIEITSRIFTRADDKTGKRLIDLILDEARQKGTGKWASQDAMELQVPIPTIDAAVSARDLSAYKAEREEANRKLSGPEAALKEDRDTFLKQLRNAFYSAMIITHTQGMALLTRASREYHYNLVLEDIAAIWRGGCIIRAALLERIRTVYQENADLPNLLLSELGEEVAQRQDDLRGVVESAARAGIPAPAFMASLAYFDGYRSAWLPANLIQAQRDYFGAHTYERVDIKGVFHTQWEQ